RTDRTLGDDRRNLSRSGRGAIARRGTPGSRAAGEARSAGVARTPACVMAKKTDLLVGLDLGTSKVAVAVGDLTADGIAIVGVGSAACLEGLRRGVVVNIDATVQAIEQAVKEAELTAGCEIHSVFADVSGGHIKGFNSHGVVAVKGQEIEQVDVDRV